MRFPAFLRAPLALGAVLLLATSCSDDDDDDYAGPATPTPQTVTIT